MSSIATAFVEIRPDTRKGQAETKAAVKDMAQEATKTLAQFFSAAVVVNEFRKVIDSAARLEQAVGGTEAIFGKFQTSVNQAAATSASAMGLSEAAFRELTSQIGGLLNGLEFTQEESAKTSINLAQLGADLAATFGGKPEEAVQALGAALRGEFNPLERFGVSLRQSQINLKAVEMGLATSTTQVDANARAQAALALIYENSTEAQGQFGREQDTAAGRAAIFTAELENVRAKLGEELLPMFVTAVNVLSVIVGAFSDLPGPIQVAIVALIGLVAIAGPMATLATTIKAVGLAIATANPWLLAAGAAVAVLAGIVVHFTGKVEESNERIDAMAESMDSVGDAAEGLAAYLLQASKDSDILAQSIDAAGLTIEDVANAALAGGQQWLDVYMLIAKASRGLAPSDDEQASMREFLDALPAEAAAATDKMELLNRITGEVGTAAASTASDLEVLDEELRNVDDSALNAQSGFDQLRDAATRLSDAFDDLIGGNLDAEAAFDAVFAAADATNKQLQENDRTLDGFSETGRANRAVIREQIDATLAYAAAMVEQGATSEEAAAEVLSMTEGLRQQMLQAGYTEDEVNAYLATLGLTPENVTTSIEAANVEAAKARVQEQLDKLGELPASKATEIEALIDAGQYAEAERQLNFVARNRSVVFTAKYGGGYDPRGGVDGNTSTPYRLGGFVGGRTFAELGEDGVEAVLPLTKPSRLAQLLEDQRIREPVMDALGGAGGGSRGMSISVGAIYTQQPQGVSEELEYLAWKAGAR